MRFANPTPDPVDDELPDGLSSALSSSRNGEDAKPSGSIVGTSTKIEKSYLRLTTYPRPQDVRPLPVLRMALEQIKNRYIADEDFEWANDQLKAVRQDITVQGIRCDFVLDVYETHARILLEHGDLNEFNQCQSMIRSLTQGGDILLEHSARRDEPWNANSNKILVQSEESNDEFAAYQLLYSLVQNSWSDLTSALGVTKGCGQSCQHAVLVVKSVIHNDYHTFFRLYESAPHLSAYLMDFLVKRVRDQAYDRIVASYRPTMGVERIREALKFDNLEETRLFLRDRGAVYVSDAESQFWIDCKASSTNMKKS
jgi:hypothetical protein